MHGIAWYCMLGLEEIPVMLVLDDCLPEYDLARTIPYNSRQTRGPVHLIDWTACSRGWQCLVTEMTCVNFTQTSLPS